MPACTNHDIAFLNRSTKAPCATTLLKVKVKHVSRSPCQRYPAREDTCQCDTWLLNQIHLDDTARNQEKCTAAFPQRVQHDGNRRTEAPNNPDDDPRGEPTHAKDGTREEEWERDQNKQNKSLDGIKSLELIDMRDTEEGRDYIQGRLMTTQQSGMPCEARRGRGLDQALGHHRSRLRLSACLRSHPPSPTPSPSHLSSHRCTVPLLWKQEP